MADGLGAGGALEDRLLHLADGFGDADLARAGLGAVEDGAAAPHAFAVVQDLQPLVRRVVADVEDEAVGVHDGRGAHEVLVGPEAGAAGGARRAQNALRGVVEALAVVHGLPALAAVGGDLRVGDEKGKYGAVLGWSCLLMPDLIYLGSHCYCEHRERESSRRKQRQVTEPEEDVTM